MPPAPSEAEILQTQFQAAGQAMPKEWEALHQRLAQQAAVNTALTQAVLDLQKQTEAHHRDLVRLAEEMNARQQRNDKVTEEILSLIEQMSQPSAPAASPSPAPPAPPPPQPELMGGPNP
jgi:small-conductance mechanosensitive channel